MNNVNTQKLLKRNLNTQTRGILLLFVTDRQESQAFCISDFRPLMSNISTFIFKQKSSRSRQEF